MMRTADGPFPLETIHLVDDVDAYTACMTLRNKGNPAGFSKFLAPFLSFAMRRANQKDLKLLKRRIAKEQAADIR